MAQFSVNPMLTTNAAGGFVTDFDGLMQGVAMDDPSVRNALAGGVVSTAETYPVWGGIGIAEYVPNTAGLSVGGTLGGNLRRATSISGAIPLLGFTVFNQNHSMVNSPQSPVPLAAGGMTQNFYRLGSKARIALAIDPALVSLNGGLINQPVSWDFALQRVCDYVAAYPANVITNAVWATGQITFTTTTAHGVLPGDSITISGFTPAAYNGTYIAQAGTAGSTIVVNKAVDPGADTVQGQLDAGGGALPISILQVNAGNSMTVNFDPVTGFATWNRQGSAVLALI